MQTQSFHFVLCSIIASLTLNLSAVSSPAFAENRVHFCGFTEQPPENRRYARSSAHLDATEPFTVRLIYFLPNDRMPQKGIHAKMDRLIKDVQQFYGEQMENHGFGRKTFKLETDALGIAVVHHVDGQFTDSYYHKQTFSKVLKETRGQFDISQNIYFVVVDVSTGGFDNGMVAGQATSYGEWGGLAAIPASGGFSAILLLPTKSGTPSD